MPEYDLQTSIKLVKSLKQKLFEACHAYAEDRIGYLIESIRQIQLSANEETKSSAGDKYETGRAMAQLEMDKHQLQLTEAKRLKQELSRILPDEHSLSIKSGSLIFTSRGNFYIAINAGQLTVDSQNFFVISSAAPIAQKLIGLRAGDAFTLNNQEFTILDIL